MVRKLGNIKQIRHQLAHHLSWNYSGHNKKKKVSHNDQITSGAYPVPYVPPSYDPDN